MPQKKTDTETMVKSLRGLVGAMDTWPSGAIDSSGFREIADRLEALQACVDDDCLEEYPATGTLPQTQMVDSEKLRQLCADKRKLESMLHDEDVALQGVLQMVVDLREVLGWHQTPIEDFAALIENKMTDYADLQEDYNKIRGKLSRGLGFVRDLCRRGEGMRLPIVMRHLEIFLKLYTPDQEPPIAPCQK